MIYHVTCVRVYNYYNIICVCFDYRSLTGGSLVHGGGQEQYYIYYESDSGYFISFSSQIMIR